MRDPPGGRSPPKIHPPVHPLAGLGRDQPQVDKVAGEAARQVAEDLGVEQVGAVVSAIEDIEEALSGDENSPEDLH